MTITWAQETYTKAYRFAADAHRGQLVPSTEISYIMHLSFVSMEIIAALPYHPERDGNLALQCALLHDVIEDTEIAYAKIEAVFGTNVAQGVQALTKNQTLPKNERMPDSLKRIREQPAEVWMVKLADRISNLAPPPNHWTKEKMAMYQKEAVEIDVALHKASPYLSQRLRTKIETYKKYYDRA